MTDTITLEVARYHPAHETEPKFRASRCLCEKIGWFSMR